MKYLLDTCVISDFVKGELNTQQRIKHAQPAELAISSISIMEIQHGLMLNHQRAKKIGNIIDEFISCINHLNFTIADAHYAAIIRTHLHTRGTPIGAYDILLAGTALANDLIFVTSNIKEFARVPKLHLENWREK